MSLPTLTWVQSTYASTGYATPTDAQVIDALIAGAPGKLTKWRVISSSASTYIELGGPVGTNAQNNRIIIGINPTTAYLAPDTTGNAIWVGYAPEGGTGALGTWNSATPYGADIRFTGYTRCAATALAESFYFIESEEILFTIFRDDSLDRFYGCIIGAIIDPLTGDSEADGRIYGIFNTSSTYMTTIFWNNLSSANAFMCHGGTAGNNHAYIFRPYSPTVVDPIVPHSAFLIDTNLLFNFNNGNEMLVARTYATNQAPRYGVGCLRQMYISQDRQNRTPTTAGPVFSATTAGASDAILFGNS